MLAPPKRAHTITPSMIRRVKRLIQKEHRVYNQDKPVHMHLPTNGTVCRFIALKRLEKQRMR